MLFASLNNQTTQSIEACERLIEQLKQQLAAAQEQLNHLHQQQQGELTAQATAQTALEMVAKARRMIQVAYPNSPEAMSEFNRALMEDETESNDAETQQPRLAETDEEIAVDVIVEPLPPTAPTHNITPQYNGNGHNGNGHNQQLIIGLNPSKETTANNKYLTIDQLKTLPREQLIALAAMKKVGTNGNRWHIATRLNNRVTTEDLASITKEPTPSMHAQNTHDHLAIDYEF